MIEVYTDGGYSSKRDQGGWAFVVVKNNEKIHSSCDGIINTTNNRMELQAIMEATKWLQENNIEEATIITDSMYCLGCLVKGWQRKKNVDMWEIMDGLNFNYEIKHVKGHSGDKWNSHCDMLAVHATQLIL